VIVENNEVKNTIVDHPSVVVGGISIYQSNNAIVSKNECYENPRGIAIVGSENNTLEENICINNVKEGICLKYTNESKIVKNMVSSNNKNGINLEYSNKNNITMNTIKENSLYYGVKLYLANENKVCFNHIEENMGLHSQGYDDGQNNVWYDKKTKRGNFWSDYTEGIYEIDGPSDKEDIYPMEEPDRDYDGLPDGWEERYGLNLEENDAEEDPDEDGLTNYEEYMLGTQPNNEDSDFDGVSDGEEVALGRNPLLYDYTEIETSEKEAKGEWGIIIGSMIVISRKRRKKY
jgi:parallel beta-helix repeat protein